MLTAQRDPGSKPSGGKKIIYKMNALFFGINKAPIEANLLQ